MICPSTVQNSFFCTKIKIYIILRSEHNVMIDSNLDALLHLSCQLKAKNAKWAPDAQFVAVVLMVTVGRTVVPARGTGKGVHWVPTGRFLQAKDKDELL